MAKEQRFRLDEQSAAAYVRGLLPDFFEPGTEVTVSRLEDGGGSAVFRVAGGGRSLFVEQTDEGCSETQVQSLRIRRERAPAYVPEVYAYDPVMDCILTEDLSGYGNLGDLLAERRIVPYIGAQIGDYLARMLLPSTVLGMPAAKKRQEAAEWIQPARCAVCEEDEFTAPYCAGSGYDPASPNEAFFARTCRDDMRLKAAVGQLKMRFADAGQAFLNGQLDSGCVFVTDHSLKIRQPAGGFYGPMGYDIGHMEAHFLIAWAAASVAMPEGAKKDGFLWWLERTVTELWRNFENGVCGMDPVDPLYADRGFLTAFSGEILADTGGYCGTELIRKVTGGRIRAFASLGDRERLIAERICIRTAKRLIRERGEIREAAQWITLLHEATARVYREIKAKGFA